MDTQEVIDRSSDSEEGIISVLPLGRVEHDVITMIADGIQGIFRIPVDVREGLPVPEEAFMASRDQYNAMAIIKSLKQFNRGRSLKVLGIIRHDICNPILTYVFGEAYMGGTAAVMSYARLRVGAKGEPMSREALLERAVKVAIHEIGHTFGLSHCHRDRCVMHASNTLLELDDKLNYLCSYCELFLREALVKALKTPELPEQQQEMK